MRKPLYLCTVLIGAALIFSLSAGTRNTRSVSAAPAGNGDYVLTAGQWTAQQDVAVQQAGGTVIYKHGKAGFATVTSDNPNFLDQVMATGVISSATADEVVQWQMPVHEVTLDEQAVNPANESFIKAQWNHLAVDAPGAWAAGYDGTGVRVAVIDGGIHNTHVDLVGRVDIAKSASFVPGFAFNQDTGTFWHGTHVAGIIAANDNATGTVGIAPGATIIGCKALHGGSGSFGGVIAAILYASTPQSEGGAGADIINMSLGATFPKGGGPGTGQLISSLNKAVNYAGSNGVLVISAAGNDGLDLDHSKSVTTVPAMSGNGLAISATGPEGYAVGYPNGATNFRDFASYSNWGNSLVTVAGPGGDFRLPGSAICTIPRVPTGTITLPCWVFDMVVSTSRGSGASTTTYSWAAGTSMAAPAVSAVAALTKQSHPGISLGALKAKLMQSADDEGKKGNDPFYGKGFINAAKAVQ
ncbi:MAG: S8 family peptidase [Pyrinomonadaceae bacterium]